MLELGGGAEFLKTTLFFIVHFKTEVWKFQLFLLA